MYRRKRRKPDKKVNIIENALLVRMLLIINMNGTELILYNTNQHDNQ